MSRALVLVLLVATLGCGAFVRTPPPETPQPEPPPAPEREEPAPAEPPPRVAGEPPRDVVAEPLPDPPLEMDVPEIEPTEPEPAPAPGPGEAAAAALAARGREALAAGRPDEAIELLDRALRIAPNRPGTYLDLARAYLSKGLGEQALGLVSRAELLLGGEAGLGRDGLLLKAACLEAVGRDEEARRVREAAG